MDSLFNRPTYFSNIGNTTRAGNKVDTLRVLRVDRVFHISKRIFNGVEMLERRRDINLPKYMGNPILGSLDIQEMNLRDRISTSKFNSRHFPGHMKGLEALISTINIIFKNLKKMRFLMLKVVIMRDS